MSSYRVVNILDLINEVGEDEVRDALCKFSCGINQEIEKLKSLGLLVL